MVWDIVLAAVALIVLFALLAAAAGYAVFRAAIRRPVKPKPESKDPRKIERRAIRDKNNAALYALKPEDFSLATPDGLTLKAWFLPAEKPSKRFAICVHGYKCNGPDEFSHMMPFYHQELGYNYLLPDDRAHGRSEGKYIGFGCLDYKDILQWANYLIERYGEDIEIILHGISMGAVTVMLANANNPPPQIKLVIEDCGFTTLVDEMKANLKEMTRPKLSFLIPLGSIWCRLIAGYRFADADCIEAVKKAKNPVLFIHGAADTFVPTDMVYRLFEACAAPKDLLVVEGAVHAYSYYDAPELYREKVRNFITLNTGSL